MVGAEWRKASRLFEALREKVKAGEVLTDSYVTEVMFQAWEELPADFRAKMERKIWDKQYTEVRRASEESLKVEQRRYEDRIQQYKDAEKSYQAESEKLALERQKLQNAQAFIKLGEAMARFFKESGIASNARWYDGVGT